MEGNIGNVYKVGSSVFFEVKDRITFHCFNSASIISISKSDPKENLPKTYDDKCFVILNNDSYMQINCSLEHFVSKLSDAI